MSGNRMEAGLEEMAAVEENERPRIKIPWDKIDEWIATVSFECEDPKCELILDPGDRRN